jgi:CubicO group peptidase (beta-lactamase class C family)
MTVEATLQAGAQALLAHGMPGAVLGIRTPAGEAFGCAGSRGPHTPLDGAQSDGAQLNAQSNAQTDAAQSNAQTGGAQPNAQTGDPMTPGTAFDLASVTKVLATTTSIVRLVSAGQLALEHCVDRYLPQFTGGAKSDVTVHQLLAHRAGLEPWWPLYLATAVDADPHSDDAHSRSTPLELAMSLPLVAQPGAARLYSDLGFMLLGRVIEVVTGERLTDAVTRLVLAPLGLSSTRYAHPVAGPVTGPVTAPVAASSFGDSIERQMVETGVPYPVPYRAADFANWRDRLLVGEVNDGNAFHSFGGVSGHAGLFSTPRDVLSFGAALSDYRERDDLWNPRVAEEFFAASADPAQGLGFRRYEIDLGEGATTVLGHPGFTGVAVGFVPGASVAFVIATNRLLAPTPVPSDRLWSDALPVWRAALAQLTDLSRRSAL